MRVAAVQLNSTADKPANLATAERLVRAAAADGAELIGLPEKWNILGPPDALRAGAEPLDGPTLTAVAEWARELGVAILAGSITEAGGEQLHNTSVLIDRDGSRLASYRKIHMFDVDVGGVSYRESEVEQAGDEIVEATVEVDAAELGVGLSICYDLRFPELYRILALRGARLLTVPAAFTIPTGSAHWEPLLRARAIENQAFVLAPGQVGPGAAPLRLLGPLDDRRPMGRGPRPGRARRGVRGRRPGSRRAGANPHRGPVARQPPPALVPLARVGGGSRLMAKAPPADRRRQILDAGDPRLRPPGLPLVPRLGHRRRGGGRLRARLPLLQVQGPGDERALHRALVAAVGGDRGGRRRGRLGAREARHRGALHHRVLPLRPGADEGHHRRGHAGGQLVWAHSPAGHSPGLRVDREDRLRRSEVGRVPLGHRPA